MVELLSPSKTVADLRHGFESGLTKPLSWRRTQLRQLLRLLREGEAELLAALASDMRKPAAEGWILDIGAMNAEISYLLRHLEAWSRPRPVHVPMRIGFGRASVIPEPLGVVLVIAPWNYPILLLLLPMAAAIAAGNAVVGKPSELAPATSAALARLIPKYLDERAVAIMEGGPEETTEMLAERWDYIFYTGNGRVGRIVMEAAAKHLTPVTLELGGKSPVIVDRGADLELAAKRIAWGKFVNAGQTCVAPDYVLVHRDVEKPLLEELATAVRGFYGADPRLSRDYARIVNDRHLSRLQALLQPVDAHRFVVGGEVEVAQRYIAPTIIRDASWDEPLMADEIFGPILPVITVPDIDSAIESVNAHPKPLALYIFSPDNATADRIIDQTSSGGVCVNGTLLQLGAPGLPLGGVGASGMGAYHGQFGFDTFTHQKGVLKRSSWPDPSFTYPPYTRLKDRIMRRLF